MQVWPAHGCEPHSIQQGKAAQGGLFAACCIINSAWPSPALPADATVCRLCTVTCAPHAAALCLCVVCRRWWLRWAASSTSWAASSSSSRGPLAPTVVLEGGRAAGAVAGMVVALGRGQVAAVVLQGVALGQARARLGPLPLVVAVAPVAAMTAAHRAAAWAAALVVHSLAWAALQQQQQQWGVMQQVSHSHWGHAPSVAAC